MKKLLSIFFALVLVLTLGLVTATPAAAGAPILVPTLKSVGDGSAEWSTGQVKLGSGPNSVLLDAGDVGYTGDAGIVKVFVDPIPIATFTGASYYVWEPTGTEHGGEFPYVTAHPYGDPYINIYLDTDGDGVYDDYLEGLGSITFGTAQQPATHPTPDLETWVQMEEGYGFYDGDNSLLQGTWTAPESVGTLTEWKAWFATNAPDVTVVGVQIVFGSWADAVTPDVYVEDVEISGTTYDLEPATGTVTMTAASLIPPPVIGISLDKASVDFGTVEPSVASAAETVTVTNTGNVAEDFSATIENESPVGVYTTGLMINAVSVSAWEDLNVAPAGDTGELPLVLTVPGATPPGTYTATLVFWAEASP